MIAEAIHNFLAMLVPVLRRRRSWMLRMHRGTSYESEHEQRERDESHQYFLLCFLTAVAAILNFEAIEIPGCSRAIASATLRRFRKAGVPFLKEILRAIY